MQLAQILFTQGFGTRRICAGIVASGRVRIGGRIVDDPHAEFDTAGLVFEVEGRPWPYIERALLMLHKPAGYECSQKPRHHPSVLSLLPQPLRTRGVQPVGRLDEDTTGLLLLTDDGTLIHRLTSPKWHVPKVYEVGTKHPVDDAQIARLLAGVVLDDDPASVRAAACERSGERSLTLTLTEGKYHQVKRMVAAAGNRVETLHRSAFGELRLSPDLPPGSWRFVDAHEIDAVSTGPVAGLPDAAT
ncbi:MAG TPA: 16S rRNA pseudouridine(516) synthase [Rubrivivax sp.]|nr:16S rRNA pseudouridine(516) synthase [Rubrivivax sp.]